MIVKKLLSLTLIIFLFSCDSDENDDPITSNSAHWEKTYGGYYSDYFRSVQQTPDGGYILAGYTASFGAGKDDGWLIKIDENGNELWSKTFGGYKNDHINFFVQTTDGGYILAGYTESFGADYKDGWLIKTDENGNEQWNQTFGGPNSDYFNSVQQTKDGGYILAGDTAYYTFVNYIKVYNEDVWLIKTDEFGIKQWSQTFGGNYSDYVNSIQQTKDGGYILAGITQPSRDTFAGWLIKTDKNGNEQWSRTFGGPEYERINFVQQTADGGYVLVGKTSIEDSGWLIKTDENGNEQWSQTFGGSGSDYINSVQITKDGGYILAGTTSSFEDTMYGDGWLIKTDENGNEQWSQTFGGYDADYIFSVKQTRDGGYILAGMFRSFEDRERPGFGDYYDGWLIKTDINGSVEE